MKQYIALAIGLLTSVGVAAQDCTEKAQKLIIDKIKNYNPTDLVPYSKNGYEWAFIDSKSKKQVTDFILQSSIPFSPKYRTYLNNRIVNIEPDYSFTAEKYQEYAYYSPRETSKATKEDLGFDVNEKGEIAAYSKTYKRQHSDLQNISNPILYNGKYYAILKKEGENVLIDQKGVEQEAFRFKEMFSIKHKNNGEEVFYVEDKEGQKGFTTLSGRKILYGKLISPAYDNNLDYSVQTNEIRGEKKATLTGILDLTTQTWHIKPQNQYKIYNVLYSSTEEIDKYDARNRGKAKIFFLATDKEGKNHFVLDKKGKPILPKK